MVLRYCLGMIMSVSTLIIWSGAATPSRVVNLSIKVFLDQHYCPSEVLFLAARRLPVKPALRNPASLVTCPTAHEMRGNADVDRRSGQQNLGHQIASGHRGG